MLDADPTRNIANSPRIAGVMARGRWFAAGTPMAA
jgi:hypothetical protein